MFTMGQKIRNMNNTEFYHKELCANDYYSEGETAPSEWFGKLAEHWDVKGQTISRSDFQELMRHRCPWDGGKSLTAVTAPDAVSWFPFQCSAQKSVSIMAVVFRDQRLINAHRECVKMALAELERFAAHRVRTGADRNSNRTQITGNLLAALYHHDASRALDPQLHTHCVIANVTIAPDGRRMALTESEMMKAVEFAGRLYQSSMARKCMEFGYKIRYKTGSKGMEGFEIDGVSDAVMQRYSRRRDEIEEEIRKFEAEHGREPTSAEINIIALTTRDAKLKEISTPEVRALQYAMLTPEERKELAAIRIRARSSVLPSLGDGAKIKIICGAIDSLYERKSVLAKHELYSEALKVGMGRLTMEDIERVVQKNLVRLASGDDELQTLYTTLKWQKLEQTCIDAVNAGINRYAAYGKPVRVPGITLSPDQARAVEGVLSSRDFAVIVRGAAGAGKTTALRALDVGLKAAGKDVIYLAPTRGAVNVLKEDGFFNATTAAAFLQELPQIGTNTVIVIDEGSLIGNTTGYRLLSKAAQSGARIVFNGDTRQHSSVDAGDFMRMLETSCKIKKYELMEIKRQIPEEYRQAIKEMAAGQTAAGLERLRALGAVTEAKAEYLDKAAQYYTENVLSGKKTMLVSPTHKEIDALTSIVRKHLCNAGYVESGKSIERLAFVDYGYTKSQLGTASLYQPGMAVRFNLFEGQIPAGHIRTVKSVSGDLIRFDDGSIRRAGQLKDRVSLGMMQNLEIARGDKLLITANSKIYGLTNGDLVEVESVRKDKIRLTNGKVIPPDFISISYGYATTSHKSQGATTEEVILAAATLDDKACYVGSSRGRKSVRIICPEYDHLLHGVKRNSDRMTVSEAERISQDRF